MMNYHDMILKLAEEFTYQPEIMHEDKLPHAPRRIIVAGMGGSRLGADILNMYRPDLEIHIHSDYGLPGFSPDHLKQSLVIACSYSGTTVETISAAQAALEHGIPLAIITCGGPLLELAQKHAVPYVVILTSDMAPRLAVGYEVAIEMAILAHMLKIDRSDLIITNRMDRSAMEVQAQKIAEHLFGKVPLVYVPNRYNGLGYIWKIILNETGKTPAFANRFPETNHNEMAGFLDAKSLPAQFAALMIDDGADPRITERMEITADLFEKKGITTMQIPLAGDSAMQKIISSITLGHFVGYALSQKAGVEAANNPSINEFKKRLKL